MTIEKIKFFLKKIKLFALLKEIYIFNLKVVIFLLDEIPSKIENYFSFRSSDLIEDVFKQMKQENFRGWALSKSSIRSFFGNLLDEKKTINLIELGGGVSTYFLHTLTEISQKKNYDINVTTFEHDTNFVKLLNKETQSNNRMKILHFFLKQISNDERKKIFSRPFQSFEFFKKAGIRLTDKNLIQDTTIPNVFYEVFDTSLFQKKIDAIILDGPHGNGRSLVFPLLSQIIKEDAFILIDDFDHYPFLADLEKIFKFQIIEKSTTFDKHWIVLRLAGFNPTFEKKIHDS